MFENVPQAGQDRLIGATGRLVDALPIAGARVREKRRTRPAAKMPLGKFRFAASRETR